MHTRIHAHIQEYIHTYMHTYIHTYMAMLIQYTSSESIYKNSFNHLLFHVHACMHTYTHTHIYRSLGATSESNCQLCPPQMSCVEGSTSSNACQCSKGYTLNASGACVECGAGTYKSVLGSSACSNCSKGTYAATTGNADASACLACPDNSQTVASGSVTETQCLCDAGYMSGDSGCVQCPAGTYKSTLGSSCVVCPQNTYSGRTGATDAATCVKCPAYSASPAQSINVASCVCMRGYTGPAGGPCSACPAGSYCLSGTITYW
jgi:hypothetical protein